MKRLPLLGLCAVALLLSPGVRAADRPVDVTQHHNHPSRDGLFIDPAFTRAAAAGLQRDSQFDGAILGHVYAQPLYVEGGPGNRAKVIAVTESNNVYALDAITGGIIWQRNVGAAVSRSDLPCGNIDPLGITGTPIVDLPSRALFFDAMTSPDGGKTKKHLIYSVNVDTGAINSGWPVDVSAAAKFGELNFVSEVQNERAALAIVGDTLYVPYGGHYGDCGPYHGWVVGVRLQDPKKVSAWATENKGGGIWGVGGIASDGRDLFVVTGNTFNADHGWRGGNAVIRLQPGPVFSNAVKDYWAPPDWRTLDQQDIDMGGSGAVLIDLPGATPSALVLALGKDGKAYLLDRQNLGGITEAVATDHVSGSQIIQAAATYKTSKGTYVAFRGSDNVLKAFRIAAGKPPRIVDAWSVDQRGRGSPFVTTTNGSDNVIVWAAGAEGDERLHGYDGDTGAVIFDGGKESDKVPGLRRFSTGIVARGRIYLAGDDKVFAFTLRAGK